MPTVHGHEITSTIPFGTKFRSVAKVRSVNRWKARAVLRRIPLARVRHNQSEKRSADESTLRRHTH